MAGRLQKGSYGQAISVLLKNADGTAYDLTGNTALKFRFLKNGASSATEVDASVVGDATDGQLSYTWADGNLDTEGPLRYQWKVTKASEVLFTEIRERFVAGNL